MADDIDDLLDEVENKFCASNHSKPVKSSVKPTVPSNSHSTVSVSRKAMDEDINAILDDIYDSPEEASVNSQSQSSEAKTKGQRKCFPVYLGGCSCPTGQASTVNKRACDNLRCTDCDFKVAAFDNYTWDTSIDYLFLRNNAPDFVKLKAKLCPKKGFKSYCCQCMWKSVNELMDIQKEVGLKWVCAKH